MDMDQAIAEVRLAEEGVKRAFAAVEEAKQTLQRAAVRLLLDRSDDEEATRELIRRLYWEVPQVPVKALEVAVGAKGRVRELAGPGPVLGACGGCGEEIRATSRSHMTTKHPRCKPCEDRQRSWWTHRREPEQEIPAWYETAPLDDWEDDGGWDAQDRLPPEWPEEIEAAGPAPPQQVPSWLG